MADRFDSSAVYRFGDFVLEPAQQRLTVGDRQPVALTPKAFHTLLCLVKRSGDLVTKQELLASVWPDVIVEEAILARNVADLRRALGDDSSTPRYIETLPKRGYRFIARVTIVAEASVRDDGAATTSDRRTVDTLQLVAESPVTRSSDTPLKAPEWKSHSNRGALGLILVLLALGIAGAIAWVIAT
jgi:DNA-binding winged helix-turn-helix (wHTH) protein